ncbi:MAG: glycoside hydrolase family 130 protein [Oscillospiraceae bacterium]|nr:glycoside hydrolase family 130 protein [Oscillospiraceae bacterium]
MSKMIGSPLPNIPWQDKPAACTEPIWRYERNPVIPRNAIPRANSIFNSAVVPYGDGFAGVFRCDDKERRQDLYTGFSSDGINWTLENDPIRFTADDPEINRHEYKYDPRVCLLDGKYYVTWCNGYHGPTIGVGYTEDFKSYVQLENAFLPYNRNGVLFPRKIGGNYAMVSRPSDMGHTAFGDIFYSESPDLVYWGKHRHVMAPTDETPWQSLKIGAGPTPIETDEGWLLIYHGVLLSCNGYVYSFGAAMLDLAEPWKVLYRSRPYLMSPQELYEIAGDVPNVAFPCAALTDPANGKIAIYYGCADTTTGLAFTTADELTAWLKGNSF